MAETLCCHINELSVDMFWRTVGTSSVGIGIFVSRLILADLVALVLTATFQEAQLRRRSQYVLKHTNVQICVYTSSQVCSGQIKIAS